MNKPPPRNRRPKGLYCHKSKAGVSELREMKKPVNGMLEVRRHKTQVGVRIPLWISIDKLGLRLSDSIEQCTVPDTEFLLWKYWKGGYQQLSTGQLNAVFNRIRERSGIKWESTPPTLYEIRSLSIRLHDQQGVINSTTLAAHSSPRSTEIYRNLRGSEWVEVEKAVTKNLQKNSKANLSS